VFVLNDVVFVKIDLRIILVWGNWSCLEREIFKRPKDSYLLFWIDEK